MHLTEEILHECLELRSWLVKCKPCNPDHGWLGCILYQLDSVLIKLPSKGLVSKFFSLVNTSGAPEDPMGGLMRDQNLCIMSIAFRKNTD